MFIPSCDVCRQPVPKRNMSTTLSPCGDTVCAGLAHVACLNQHLRYHGTFTCACGQTVRHNPQGGMMLVVVPEPPPGRVLLYYRSLSLVISMAWLACFILWACSSINVEKEPMTSIPFQRWFGPMASYLFTVSIVCWFITLSMFVCMDVHYRGRIPYE